MSTRTQQLGARTQLAVICGGRSPEHAVSVVSARSILREADAERFDVVPFGITRGGRWLTPDETRTRLDRVERGETDTLGDDEGAGVLGEPQVLAALAQIDVAFPIVHGRMGEDGTLQGFLETAEIPYVGSGVAASAIGMDKEQMRAVFERAGIPQPRYQVLRDDEAHAPSADALRAIETNLGYPCFVKPANGGSSLGISKAHTREELLEAVALAARYDRKVLVEAAIQGGDLHEVECAILGNADAQAALPEATSRLVQEYALQAYRAVDCAGLARVDFFVQPPGDVHIIEVNTLPGFTPISMYPRLWQHAGISYPALITRLAELAIERHTEAKRYA